jgi:hypothetical protein
VEVEQSAEAASVKPSILEAVGNTGLVELRSVVPPNCARIAVKLESQNPTGSMKDRMAVTAISRAEEDGRLKPGDTVVEYTGGSTGASLAMVCAAKGYGIHVVSSTAFSAEKLNHMRAHGAQLTLVPHNGRGITKQLFSDTIDRRLRCGKALVVLKFMLQVGEMTRHVCVKVERRFFMAAGFTALVTRRNKSRHQIAGLCVSFSSTLCRRRRTVVFSMRKQ